MHFIKFIIIFLLVILACRKESDVFPDYKKYMIYQGSHYSSGWGYNLCTNDISFNYIFDISCAYNDSLIIPGWNKLKGFSSVALEGNHDYSCRLAWRYDSKIKKIIIGYYAYINTIRIDGELDTVNLLSINYGRTALINGEYLMQNNEHIKYITFAKYTELYFIQNPYFGGQSYAPHDMLILIKDL